MSGTHLASKRNGKIELLRFVFASTVLCFHVRPDAWDHTVILFPGVELFPAGKLGVEFFFLLSGFLMAKSIDSQYKRTPTHNLPPANLSEDTFAYVSKKVKAILPYHMLFCIVALAIGIKGHPSKELQSFLIDNVLSLFLLNSTGLVKGTLGIIAPEWYLSSMFLMMLILYPLAKRYWKTVPLTVCPFVGLLCIGYIVQTNGIFPGNIKAWGGITLYCNIRALGELCLGITSFALCEKLSASSIESRVKATVIKIIEVACYCLALYLMCIRESNTHQLVLMLFFVGLTISMSRYGAGNQSPLLQNSFMRLLGEVSLPVYLCQNVVRAIVRLSPLELSGTQHFLTVVLLTYAVGFASVLVHRIAIRRASHS